MKKILLILFVSLISFGSGMRFTMEKDKKVRDNKPNSKVLKTVETHENDKNPTSLEETGDGEIESVRENINTNIKLTGFHSNKYRLLNSALNTLMNESNTYLGIPYVWGGTTRRGLDCSAFVKNVYSSIGVVIPRVSRDQAKVGRSVTLTAARRGDLIFFKTDAKRPNTVSHVGMYIGNGKMIHASSGSGKVVIVSLNQGYFMSKMSDIKRIIDVS